MSNLLKAAIADAKAVRATALANAKAALEEAFQPKMQEMLARKLRQEMEDEEESVMDDQPMGDQPMGDQPMDVQPEDDVMPSIEDEMSVEEPAPVMEPEASEDEVEEHRLPLGYGHPDSVHQADELTEEESYALDHGPKGHDTEDAHDGDPAPKTYHKDNGGTPGEPVEKTDSMNYISREVAPIQKDPQGGDVTKTYHKDNGGTPELKEDEDYEIDDQTLDEILKELEDEVNGEVEEVKVASSAETADQTVHGIEAEVGPTGYDAVNEEDEELDLSELMESDEEESHEEKEEKHDDEVMQENVSLKAELEEYRNAVKYLRDRINEVNLLNAKLLYTNKLFKSNALTNEQKIRVIESFDRTKSVREAKLVYATLSESLSVGANAKKPIVAEKRRSTVKSITEGLASKSVASTKPTKPVVLTEGSEMANRFKKLAGIK
jgi:hypothetical protein